MAPARLVSVALGENQSLDLEEGQKSSLHDFTFARLDKNIEAY